MSENKEQDLIMNLEYLLTGAEMASCDARTSNVIGIPSLVLMERAALSVVDSVDVFLRKKFSGAGRGRRPVVLAAAGRGNNGADALAAGRILLDRGWDVRFCRLSGKISPDSSFAVQENILRQYGKDVAEFPDSLLSKVLKHQDLTGKALTNTSFSMGEPAAAVPDLIIDGLFGTGLSRDLSGQAAECVEAINFCRDRFGSYVVAVDIPSGISSDDGSVMGCAVRCDETATFAFYKRGHFLHPGTVYAGVCHLAQIGITWRAFEKMPPMFTLVDAEAADLLPVRDPGGNKGTFGKVLIAAGRRNMCGAALLAARACMAAGAGMVRIFTHEANRLIIQQAIPEALLDTFTDEETPARIAAKLRASLDWADIAAAGPAMGTDETAAALLCEILEYVQADGSRRPLRGLVLDADALRLLAKDDALCSLLAGRQPEIPCILTPHMAEFAALAGQSVPECIANRANLVQEQADRLRSTIACKDARTLVAQPSLSAKKEGVSGQGSQCGVDPVCRQYLNTTGNSGMAAAGSGDVLTGITAAFLALDFKNRTAADSSEGSPLNPSEGSDLYPSEGSPFLSGTRSVLFTDAECSDGFAAAVAAACLHGRAGDLAAAEYGKQGMTAGDIAAQMRKASFWQKK